MSNIFPSAFIRSLKEEFNIDASDFLSSDEKITSIRLNPFKPIHGYDTKTPVPWSGFGKYLDERPSFIGDPLFHAGCYYVQEASSMFLEHVVKEAVDLNDNLRVLDLCAAPGGKSTLLSSLLNKESLLVSNEIIKTRVPVLSTNLTKWGAINAVVCNNDPADFGRLPGYFDVLVADAPCSGSGMFRKDPETMQQWSESAVELCSQRQQRILADSYATLKDGGVLIYSTCSYSKEENENICDWLCDQYDLSTIKISLNESWGIVETQSDKHHCYGYRFYPHKVKGEGFFITCFKKNDGNNHQNSLKYKYTKPTSDMEIIKSWLKTDLNYSIIPVKEGYSIIDDRHNADVNLLQNKLYLKKSGVYAGKMAGKDLIPDYELALSLILEDSIPKTNLNLDEARSYLRKDEIKINSEVKGWSLMCFENYALGWAKVLANRVNNYYPKELRILKEF